MGRKRLAFTATVLAATFALGNVAVPSATYAAAPALHQHVQQRAITVTAPAPNALLTQGNVLVAGSTNYWPFEANITARVLDAQGRELGIRGIQIASPGPPQGGPFAEHLTFTLPATAQNGTLEVYETSAADGSIVVITRVPVRLAARPAATLQLDSPIANTGVTLPAHVSLRGAVPGDKLRARLRFGNGVVLERALTVETGPDGVGYAVANMAWNTEGPPPPTPSGAATFQIVRGDGTVLKSIPVNILPKSQTQLVDVAWVAPDTGELIVFKQAVYRTPRIGAAALRELVSGPPDGNLAGAGTAFPTLAEILNYAGREADWGHQVKLLSLTINNGVATANFSQELRAFGGGAARVGAIRAQVERTLKQFPTVRSVVIQIEGDSGALEP